MKGNDQIGELFANCKKTKLKDAAESGQSSVRNPNMKNQGELSSVLYRVYLER